MNTRTTPTRTAPRRRGITLIEMMVALAITTFVILVVNQLFNSVASTVARGIQGGEMLQKSRTIDEQLAFETELEIVGDASNAGNWRSRMVGPGGRNGTGSTTSPGGFLAIVQRVVNAPLTLEDLNAGTTRPIRSDQLVFIYDQQSDLDSGAKRMPAMAPANGWSFTGDDRDSQNAEYARIWYGHVLKIRPGDDPLQDFNNLSDYQDIELGNPNGTGNPNILAQDWVLGRHVLFLTDSSGNPGLKPYGPYTDGLDAFFSTDRVAISASGSPIMANGVCDVANLTLADLTGAGSGGLLDGVPILTYQQRVLFSMFTLAPLLTSSAKPGNGQLMRAWDVAPSHTYFMGGVSDFIVEWAGDVVNAQFTGPISPALMGPDGELDRDGQGRIKWYTALPFSNPVWNPAIYNAEQPMTEPAPPPSPPYSYYPNAERTLSLPPFNTPNTRANAAFVWQHVGSPNFTSWPWMIRIRYRLHDRRGEFEGRQITDPNNANKTIPEKGVWYELIIPVNHQGL